MQIACFADGWRSNASTDEARKYARDNLPRAAKTHIIVVQVYAATAPLSSAY